jgi:NAD(P)-dependent dehydrogenase (short-subunit alcohol dehydrogenase family)
MQNILDGHTAIVTGAGGGIGTAVTTKLARLGASVGLLDMNESAAVEIAESLSAQGLKAFGCYCDVTDESSVRQAFDKVRNQFGDIGILVNNAGIIRHETLAETTLAMYEKTMDVNALGPFLCSKEAAIDMKQNNWGKIVTVGSSAGKTGGSNAQGVYGSAKAAAMNMTKALAKELAGYGVNVNAVAPALIRTNMINGIEEFVKAIPLGRIGEPEDVANVIAFLCTEESSFITGEIIDVNGGFLID